MNISMLNRLRCSLNSSKYSKLLEAKLFCTNTEGTIKIPKRIKRNSTDLLYALETITNKDPTAAHYKYHDDPFLIPMSNIGKRTFALAQEAGRKAALWVRQEHADLFQHKEADPPIEAFFPRAIYHENSEVTEEDLIKVISDVQVTDAILIYKLLKEKGTKISQELHLALLELLCYCNSDDTLSDEFIEERWFKQSTRGKERTRKTWKDGGFAEEIFISIDNPPAEAYSAIIQGMAKYYQVDRAWQLFEEAGQKNLIVNTDAYNAIINVANFLKEGYDLRWTFIINLLSQMEKAKLKPNLGTFNAVLHSLSTMGTSKIIKERALATISEFKSLGIEPSLASWYFVLNTFCKERGPTSTILNDILNLIENKEHHIRDIRDTNFFVTAMDVCRNHLRDINLAKRVDRLLHYGNNYDLIGDSFKESIYYRHFFVLLCTHEPLEEFMSKTYENLVPNIYVPEPGVMSEVLNQVEINGLVEYIPQLWSDMVVFDHANRENLVEQVLTIATNSPVNTNSDLNEKLAIVAWNIYTRIDEQNENRTLRLRFTGDVLGKIMILVLRSNNFNQASIVMNKLDKGHTNIVGVPQFEAMSLFVDACIEHKAPSKAINCIQYCADCGFPEANILAARLNEKCTLDEVHLNSLSKIVGDIPLLPKLNN